MVKRLVIIVILLIICSACSEKAKYYRKLNGTWITSHGRTYILKHPHIEYRPPGENMKGSKEKIEASKGTYEADESCIYVTFTHSKYNGIWKEVENKKIVKLKYKLKEKNLILTNPLGQAITYKKQ